MNNLFDKKVFVTGVLILVAAFFLRKWFTKRVKKADGTESNYVGHESVGFA
ncbi:hypothetical protein [Pseudopedobacter beijingensis]|uniref:PEP-CTERM protein-sorting domain-containing protein n=1 Tax=Pseudopedobacter beijingensis TaxID=1207056 RepID=A0ABW4IGX5_9SPHI